VRSRYRCSMCPAIHITSRSWLRSSSTHEPSDPPLRVVSYSLSRLGSAVRARRRPPQTTGAVSVGQQATDSNRTKTEKWLRGERRHLSRPNSGKYGRPERRTFGSSSASLNLRKVAGIARYLLIVPHDADKYGRSAPRARQVPRSCNKYSITTTLRTGNVLPSVCTLCTLWFLWNHDCVCPHSRLVCTNIVQRPTMLSFESMPRFFR